MGFIEGAVETRGVDGAKKEVVMGIGIDHSKGLEVTRPGAVCGMDEDAGGIDMLEEAIDILEGGIDIVEGGMLDIEEKPMDDDATPGKRLWRLL